MSKKTTAKKSRFDPVRLYKFYARKKTVSVEEELLPYRDGYKKSLLNISSGIIVLTFTILQLFDGDPLKAVWMLKLSWLFFGATIVLVVLTQLLSFLEAAAFKIGVHITGKSNSMEDLEEPSRGEAREAFGHYLAITGKRVMFELWAWVPFLAGFSFLVAFIFFNF